jgi:hypothetical protein
MAFLLTLFSIKKDEISLKKLFWCCFAFFLIVFCSEMYLQTRFIGKG